MKNFDVICDGRFVGRVAAEDVRKLQRKFPFQGVSFVETAKGLCVSLRVAPEPETEPEQLSLGILHPPCK